MNNLNLNSIKINEEKIDEYVLCAKDASFFTGLMQFCSTNKNDKDFNSSFFFPFTLLPSPFLHNEYEFAVRIQQDWNILLHLCSNDIQFIYEALKDVIETDDFISKHWKICETVNKEGVNQPITLNIMRIDYLLDEKKVIQNNGTILSQVEINTFACGGCAVPTKLADLHRYMLHKTENDEFIEKTVNFKLYENVVNSLIYAWKLYKNSKAQMLLVVREKGFIYGDHRLLEYKIFEKEPSIKFLRLTLGQLYKRAKLDNEKRLFVDDNEIALVYFKSGFDPSDYFSENEFEARLLIERSKAIKAPKIEYQLICTKKFQQFLYEKGTLERFIKDKNVLNSLRSTFVKQYSFEKGKENYHLLDLMKNDYDNWVIKPQREGGGNNIYGIEIKKIAENIKDEKEMFKYVLMERIKPLAHSNYIIDPTRNVQKLNINSELGVFGITIGDNKSSNLVLNEFAGTLLKSKDVRYNEGGILKGFGAFDSPFLV